MKLLNHVDTYSIKINKTTKYKLKFKPGKVKVHKTGLKTRSEKKLFNDLFKETNE